MGIKSFGDFQMLRIFLGDVRDKEVWDILKLLIRRETYRSS